MARSQPYPLELIDETLDINATDNYDLTLELSDEGVSLAVLDLLRGKYVMLRHYPREDESATGERAFSEIVASDDFLGRRYRKVYIVAPSLNATLIPSTVYEKGLREDYFRFNFSPVDDAVIMANTLPFPDAVVLFSPSKEVHDSISGRWHDVTPWHHSKPLLNHVSAACRTNDGTYVHIHYEKDFVTVITAEKRSLTFFNSFATTSPQDGAYYLFNVLDRNSIKHEETINVSGTVEPYGEAHISLLSFAHNVRFASPVIRQGFSYVMNEVQMHRWLNLFTAASCE